MDTTNRKHIYANTCCKVECGIFNSVVKYFFTSSCKAWNTSAHTKGNFFFIQSCHQKLLSLTSLASLLPSAVISSIPKWILNGLFSTSVAVSCFPFAWKRHHFTQQHIWFETFWFLPFDSVDFNRNGKFLSCRVSINLHKFELNGCFHLTPWKRRVQPHEGIECFLIYLSKDLESLCVLSFPRTDSSTDLFIVF